MKRTVTLAPLEKELMHEMRNIINRVEDTIDLENRFSSIMKELVEKACEKQKLAIDVTVGDIMFNPERGNYYVISKKLKTMAGFMDLWDSSDLKSVIARFADTAHRKYIHMHKHQEKARFKIR